MAKVTRCMVHSSSYECFLLWHSFCALPDAHTAQLHDGFGCSAGNTVTAAASG